MSAGRVLATQQARAAAKQMLALTGTVKEHVGRVLQQGNILADPHRWDGGHAGKWRNDWGQDASQLNQTAAKLEELERRAQQVVEDIFKADSGPLGTRSGNYDADTGGLAEPVVLTSDGSPSVAAMSVGALGLGGEGTLGLAEGALGLGAEMELGGLALDGTIFGAPAGVVLGVAGGVVLAVGAVAGIISMFSRKQQPPELTQEEQEALDAKKDGTLRKDQQQAYKRALRKKQQEEKFKDERNKGKQRGQPNK